MSKLTAARAREVLTYDPDTGIFVHRLSRRGVKVGARAGSVSKKGYRYISIDGKLYRAPRLAWLIVTGEWPAREIDHENNDRSDERFENLRPATRAQQNQNRKPKAACSLKGVSWHKHSKKWVARIGVGRRRIALGNYKTAEEAHQAYADAAIRMFGEFARVA